MPFNLSFQPAQPLVAQAGFQSGVGDYNRFLSNLQLQQQNLQLQNVENLRGLQEQQYQTQYGGALQSYLQNQSIANQQTMQARDIASQQYQQQQALLNARVMQGNQLNFAGWQQLSQQANQANLAAMSIGANQWSQQYAANVNSALSAQNYMQQLGLGDQSFTSSAALQNLQTANAMQLNAANLQTQADFKPVLSEEAYQAQQQEFANRGQVLQNALNNGTIDQNTYNMARNQLMAQQVGLRSMMPSSSDVSNTFARQSYTDPQTGTRYLYNSQSGSFQVDPGYELAQTVGPKSAAVQQRQMAQGQQQINAVLSQIATLAQGYLKVDPEMSKQEAYSLAEQQIMGTLQQSMGFGG